MNTDLPAPLTPPDCDIRGYDYMPLFGHRLFTSTLNARASDLEFRCAIRLWWGAWQQRPAGSLPNDDATLARMADFGRDVRRWKRVRDVALYGFILCSDGRLYHPTLSREALKAYRRRESERLRKSKQREQTDRDPEANTLNTNAADANVPRDIPRDVPGTGTGTSRVRGEERREEKKESERTDPEISARESHSPPPAQAQPRTPQPIMPTRNDQPEAWAHLCDRYEPDDDGVMRPVVAGWFIDLIAGEVCDAAGIDAYARAVDWRPLIGWLREGIEAPDIVAAIRRVAGRPSYQPPRFLTYFEKAIREVQPA